MKDVQSDVKPPNKKNDGKGNKDEQDDGKDNKNEQDTDDQNSGTPAHKANPSEGIIKYK